jgi:probable HAF family extracellular repeat protein
MKRMGVAAVTAICVIWCVFSVGAWAQAANPGNDKLHQFHRPQESTSGSTASVATKLTGHNWTTTDFPGAGYTIAYDLDSTNSMVVGSYIVASDNRRHGFTLKSGTYSTIDVPGAISTECRGTNPSGQIVGWYWDNSSVSHGFLYSQGSFMTIDPVPFGTIYTLAIGINDMGEIVGDWSDSSNNQHGFLYNSGVYTSVDYPGAMSTAAWGINHNGEIVGVWIDSSFSSHGFIVDPTLTNYTSLDHPGAFSTRATGINDSGVIAGDWVDSSNVGHGFIYSSGQYQSVDIAGASSTDTYRIKNKGQLVGSFVDAVRGELHGVMSPH